MSEEKNEWKPLSGFSPQHYLEAAMMLLPSLLYEAQIEGAKRKEQAEDFVESHPHEVDKELLELPVHRNFENLVWKKQNKA
jgi:hypothetical protein